jgi:hypothetical protein
MAEWQMRQVFRAVTGAPGMGVIILTGTGVSTGAGSGSPRSA